MGAAGEAFEALVELMARLRAPDGCPWDREQTLQTMKAPLVEETWEVLEAIDDDDVEAHREELGDLLFQVVFQARLRQEEGAFDAAAVARGIHEKLVRRHPHVFGDEDPADREAVRRRWSEIKAAEKPRESALDGVPKRMPALQRAQRLGGKASSAGFDWRALDGVQDKIDEEVGELREALEGGEPTAIAHELGDLLFSVVNLARHLRIDAEAALHGASDRFDARYRTLERGLKADGKVVRDEDDAALDARWQAAKRALAEGDQSGS